MDVVGVVIDFGIIVVGYHGLETLDAVLDGACGATWWGRDVRVCFGLMGRGGEM